MTTTALFVMPRQPDQWGGAAALWITAAGWAEAARRHFGAAWVISPTGTVLPETALGYAASPGPQSTASKPRRDLTTHARNAAKDVRQWRRAKRYTVPPDPRWSDGTLEFVWQHHDLFHEAGEQLARRYDVPLVSYVHAPQVWEARRWGVARPGYGPSLERFGERPQLRASDVVCCVSPEVAQELTRLGVPADRILVSPMAVDADRFAPDVSGLLVREQLDLVDSLVVGWTGSFRGFHGLEDIIDAFAVVHAALPTTRLVLVGDGPARSGIEAHAERLGISSAIRFTGSVPHVDIPRYVAAMDVALVSAQATSGFHYSPLKMREYLASGKAVVAPRVGEIPSVVRDGESALLYEPGDPAHLGAALLQVLDDQNLRDRLGAQGRAVAVATSTWDRRLADLLKFPAYVDARTR
jgi:glycosyltransferase involved in cell wall biosynthesis